MAGMDLKDRYAVGSFCWGRCTSRYILFSCRQAQDARHLGRSRKTVLWCILFKAVDIPVVVQMSFLMVLLFRRPRDSEVALGQDGRCPCRRVLRVPQVQVVMTTVVISQLHLVDVQMVTQTSESLGTGRGSSSSS